MIKYYCRKRHTPFLGQCYQCGDEFVPVGPGHVICSACHVEHRIAIQAKKRETEELPTPQRYIRTEDIFSCQEIR